MSFGMFSGVNITVSVNAVEKVINWPEKRRSRRLHRKLVKKRGPQFSYKPGAFQTPHGLIVHPTIYAELKRSVA